MSALENTVIVVVTIVIFYVLLGLVLSFTWNRSVAKILGTNQLDLVEAIFLLLTMNILFGTFSQSALAMYNNYTYRMTSNL